MLLQQYLPFTVLKPYGLGFQGLNIFKVAKALTVCGMYGILIESLVLV